MDLQTGRARLKENLLEARGERSVSILTHYPSRQAPALGHIGNASTPRRPQPSETGLVQLCTQYKQSRGAIEAVFALSFSLQYHRVASSYQHLQQLTK
jgi:hypothetical protein